VWTRGASVGVEQMEQSLQRMKTANMDLMQVHNLIDAEVHLPILREWKQQGKIRYIGLSHYHSGGYAEMKRLMQQPDIDFIQINYSLLNTEADQEILPMARSKGIATLINRPFEKGKLFAGVKYHTVPEWAAEFDCHSWGQFFLKFILAHPAVTCVIPGTSKVHHLADNLDAGRGRMPDEKQRLRMQKFFAEL
ncbi:MAG: aldo/keto reductase, partial [Arenicella sp.]|nr:aldo/keto reductase [Arenicella sp.]